MYNVEDIYSYENGRVMYGTISLHPHWSQFFIDQSLTIIVCIVLTWAYFFADFNYHQYLGYPWVVALVYLIYQAIYLSRTEYLITGEQLILLHGVVSHSTDYIELYRVIDYQQHQSAIQQIVGLKNVTIYSGDRNNPKVDLIGMRATYDVVGVIRLRVEYNKRRKGVYEITNRM